MIPLLICIDYFKISDVYVLPFDIKFSWPKTLVKKWLNIKSKTEDFQADDIISRGKTANW